MTVDAASSDPPEGQELVEVEDVSKFGVPETLITLSGILGRLLIVLLALAVALWLLAQVQPVAIALFLGMFLTALAGPIARLFNKIMPKVLAVVLSLLLIAAAGIYIVIVVVDSIISEGSQLGDAIRDGLSQIDDWLQNGPLSLTGDQLSEVNQKAQDTMGSLGSDLLSALASEASSIGTVITAGAVFFFATIFFMISGESIWKWLVGWMPSRIRSGVDVSGQLFWGSVAGYARGMVVVAILDALLVFVGLMILGVPLAPALAAVVFMGAFIPVIGAPIATLLAAVVALATEGLTTAILVVALTVVVGSFDGDVMQPLVMGKAVSLHPLAIVTLIAAGALTLGIVGALIAVPLGSGIYVVAKFLTNRDSEHPFPPAPEAPPPQEDVATGDAAAAASSA
ncbi:MAG: AI-2E family transporter [Actinobacteria bacterium]|nr:AI-2E family transporter [Actinomycetota bacterium]